jgi:hypothetical protein
MFARLGVLGMIEPQRRAVAYIDKLAECHSDEISHHACRWPVGRDKSGRLGGAKRRVTA